MWVRPQPWRCCTAHTASWRSHRPDPPPRCRQLEWGCPLSRQDGASFVACKERADRVVAPTKNLGQTRNAGLCYLRSLRCASPTPSICCNRCVLWSTVHSRLQTWGLPPPDPRLALDSRRAPAPHSTPSRRAGCHPPRRMGRRPQRRSRHSSRSPPHQPRHRPQRHRRLVSR